MNSRILLGVSVLVVVLVLFSVLYTNMRLGTSQSPDLRLVSLAPSDTQILISLGLGKHIVGVDSYSYSLLELLNDTKFLPSNVTIIQASSSVNVSGILLLHPSLVIDEEGLIGSNLNQLREAGLNVTLTNDDYAQNFTQIESSVLNLSSQLGVKGNGEKVVSWMNGYLNNFSRSGNTSVAYLIWICPNYEFYTAGGNVFINNVINYAGGVNVFSNQSGYPLLGPSSLILADPQVIVVQEVYNLSYTEYLINHFPGITSTKAFQDHRIYILSENLPTDLLNEPGPLAVYGVEMMNEIVSGQSPGYVNTSYVLKEFNVTLPVF
ncbi:ABC transporter substrate-binding protein [Metallosphaera hakonensis]|uniref:ABC transporter substrate-binding protein n=1 Tax=Metallosphaera hakonensis JCM 8857 = DSM 7519 TaxID=1293036 RepID=A0A2U9IRS8_9CREN|nr:ABC transporter substrate-binding protein [Metallosphaera hakonensis]AWR98740.1 ABC transporter substrate-binding protein [Metallosphaera hakonensis JCM 8857 = DSM 7519]